MKRRISFLTSSMFWQIFMVLFAFALLSSGMLYRIVRVSYQERYQELIMQRSYEALSSAEMNLEHYMTEIHSAIESVTFSDDFGSLLVSGDQVTDSSMLSMVAYMKTIVSKNTGIDQLYLLLPYSDRMISSSRISTTIQESTFAASLMEASDQILRAGDMYYMFYRYPVEKPLGILVAQLNVDQMVQQIGLPPYIYCYDQEGKPLFESSTEYPATEDLMVHDGSFDEERKLWSFSNSGGRVIMISDEMTGWKLITMENDLMAGYSPKKLMRQVGLYAAVILLFLLGAVVFLMQRMYLPLHRALQQLTSNQELGKNAKNEVEFLHAVAVDNRDERESMQKILNSVSDTVLERALIDLMAEETQEQALDSLARLESPLLEASEYFTVSIRCWYHPVNDANSGDPDEMERRVAKFSREYFQERGECYVIQTNRHEILLLFYGDPLKSQNDLDRMISRFEEQLVEIFANTDSTVALGWSEKVSDLNGLPISLSEARAYLNKKLYQRTSKDKMKERASVLDTIGSELKVLLEQEMEKKGASDVMEQMDRLIQDAYDQADPEEKEICGETLLQVLHENMERFRLQPESVAEDATALAPMQTDADSVRQAYRQAVEIIRHQGRSAQYSYVAAAKRMIAAQYPDSSLSLEVVSSSLGVSSQYLSRLFIEYQPPGFLDYLNHVRLEEGKRLLRETSMKIGDIGLQIGYGSAQSFIRVFKKYEEETPGQYRSRKKQTNE